MENCENPIELLDKNDLSDTKIIPDEFIVNQSSQQSFYIIEEVVFNNIV